MQLRNEAQNVWTKGSEDLAQPGEDPAQQGRPGAVAGRHAGGMDALSGAGRRGHEPSHGHGPAGRPACSR